jgi:hypothetical protein
MVRLEAIETVVNIMPSKVTSEQIDKEILPVFVKHLQIEHDEECSQRMSKVFGQFIFNLPLEVQRKTYAKEIIEFFRKIYKSTDLEVRRNAAFNLPCFFYYFGNYE